MIGNGLWMVVGAIEWFFNIPADMPATGDPNGHLIRDVGFAYIVFGFALNCCALKLQSRRALRDATPIGRIQKRVDYMGPPTLPSGYGY